MADSTPIRREINVARTAAALPTGRKFPYPLEPGTHVVARVKKLDLSGDVDIVGTVIRVLRSQGATCMYAVKVRSGGLIQVLAGNTLPIDTSTEEGLDLWLGAMEELKVDPAELPGPDLMGVSSDPNQLLWARGTTTTTTTLSGLDVTASPNSIWYYGDT